MDISERIRDFVIDTFLFGDAGQLDTSASLLASGVLDSTGVMELIMFLEETFRISIADEELVPENLDSIDRIERFVASKISSLRPQAEVV